MSNEKQTTKSSVMIADKIRCVNLIAEICGTDKNPKCPFLGKEVSLDVIDKGVFCPLLKKDVKFIPIQK